MQSFGGRHMQNMSSPLLPTESERLSKTESRVMVQIPWREKRVIVQITVVCIVAHSGSAS